MTLKEKIEKHKKAIIVYVVLVMLVAMIFVSVAAYQIGYNDGEEGKSTIPCPSFEEGQWFGVNNSFVRVYKWEITGNNTWRFYWEWISFENMTGSHVIQFPDDGNMWTSIPFGLVRSPDVVKITEDRNE